MERCWSNLYKLSALGQVIGIEVSSGARGGGLAAYLPTRVVALRPGLPRYQGAGTGARGFALGAGPRDMGAAVAGGIAARVI